MMQFSRTYVCKLHWFELFLIHKKYLQYGIRTVLGGVYDNISILSNEKLYNLYLSLVDFTVAY